MPSHTVGWQVSSCRAQQIPSRIPAPAEQPQASSPGHACQGQLRQERRLSVRLMSASAEGGLVRRASQPGSTAMSRHCTLLPRAPQRGAAWLRSLLVAGLAPASGVPTIALHILLAAGVAAASLRLPFLRSVRQSRPAGCASGHAPSQPVGRAWWAVQAAVWRCSRPLRSGRPGSSLPEACAGTDLSTPLPHRCVCVRDHRQAGACEAAGLACVRL